MIDSASSLQYAIDISSVTEALPYHLSRLCAPPAPPNHPLVALLAPFFSCLAGFLGACFWTFLGACFWTFFAAFSAFFGAFTGTVCQLHSF